MTMSIAATIRSMLLRIRGLFRKDQLDRELSAELEGHLELPQSGGRSRSDCQREMSPAAEDAHGEVLPEERRHHASTLVNGFTGCESSFDP